ncbi:TatD DNase family Scn1 [Mycena pura]|uniref:TatD DNase family Scn1 n=1 Tax=Mycena pura TaxID=153505 RepID=A0AAD6URZ8_9AGAR|nr:TatD DNase family Scn1 [Mycena pura]
MASLPASVLCHIVDVHCHPTETLSTMTKFNLERLQLTVCAMSTHQTDQRLVRDLAYQYPEKVIPCFGYHPWFSHFITLRPEFSKSEHYRHLFIGDATEQTAQSTTAFDELLPLLPEPITLDNVLSDLRSDFKFFSTTMAMLGEVGLDKAVRVPFDYHASPRRLSPFTIPLDHQLAILEAQLDLAVEIGVNVSLHSVKCPQATVDLLNKLQRKHGLKWEKIRIDIHSCSMNPEVIHSLQAGIKRHPNVWMSVSTTINGRSNNLNALIAVCAPDRILIESDTDSINKCTERCLEILHIVAQVKGWPIEDDWMDELEEAERGAVRRLEANWKTFIGVGGPKGYNSSIIQ